jgi:hypothetical protein
MRAILAAARSVSTHTLHVSSAFSSIVEQASLHCAAILRFVFVGELSAMFLAVSLVRACTLRRFRAVSAVGLSATLLGGCFVFEEGRRPFFDHAHYTPVGGQPEDIFIEPAGDVDRTIPNRLGRLDVAPVNYSFETDEAARKRAKLTLPPQPVIPPASKVAPQSRVLPGAQTGSQAGAQAASAAAPSAFACAACGAGDCSWHCARDYAWGRNRAAVAAPDAKRSAGPHRSRRWRCTISGRACRYVLANNGNVNGAAEVITRGNLTLIEVGSKISFYNSLSTTPEPCSMSWRPVSQTSRPLICLRICSSHLASTLRGPMSSPNSWLVK